MKPGRELDALIAEKVMGYRRAYQTSRAGNDMWRKLYELAAAEIKRADRKLIFE